MQPRNRALGLWLLLLVGLPAHAHLGKLPKFHGMHHAAPSYLGMTKAILDLNQAMKILMENPMDDWRRERYEAAKQEVAVRSQILEADVGLGNLGPDDLAAAKADLGEMVDFSALEALGESPVLGRGVAAEGESAAVEPVAAVGAAGEAAPSVLFVTLDKAVEGARADADGPLAVVSGTSESEEPASEPEEAGATSSGYSAGGRGLASSSGSLQAYGTPGAVGTGDSKGKGALYGGAPAGVAISKAPVIPVRAGRTLPPGRARVEKIKRALAQVKSGQSVAAIRPVKGAPPLSVQRLPGATLVRGDFGGEVAALRLVEKDEGGYEVEELSAADLNRLYWELAFYWALVLLPLLYGVYSLGRSGTLRRWYLAGLSLIQRWRVALEKKTLPG